MWFFAACTKDNIIQQPKGKNVLIVSEKYTRDTVLIKADTLYRACLDGRWLDTFKAQKSQWFVPCEQNNFQLEYLKYIIK
jgi:hypothetical protein